MSHDGTLLIKGRQVLYRYLGERGKYGFKFAGVKGATEKFSIPSPMPGSKEIIVFDGFFMGVKLEEIEPGKLVVVSKPRQPAAQPIVTEGLAGSAGLPSLPAPKAKKTTAKKKKARKS